MKVVPIAAALILSLAFASAAIAQAKSFRLAADAELVENGALKYLLPRFSLKTGVKIEIIEGGGDARLAADAEGQAMFQSAAGRIFRLSVAEGAAKGFADRFRDWLTSDIGQRAISKIKVDGANPYGPVDAKAVVEVEIEIEGDVVLGEEIALRRCGRCHVISKKNRFGGIGSTPSFGAMKTLPEWEARFQTFWTSNPHPAFTQIEDVTEPFDPQRPSPIAPLQLTQDELEALLAYVMTIKPKNLGGPLIVQ